MSQAFKKFQTLKRQVHTWKAKDAQKDRELEIGDKFPNCRSTFDNCPSEAEMEEALKNKIILRKCRICPNYAEK